MFRLQFERKIVAYALGFIVGILMATALCYVADRIRIENSLVLPNQDKDQSFWWRVFDNLLLVAMVAAGSDKAEIERGSGHWDDGPVGGVIAIAILCLFWHFFLRYGRVMYRAGIEQALRHHQIPFKYWKNSLLHSLISFLACLSCATIIFNSL